MIPSNLPHTPENRLQNDFNTSDMHLIAPYPFHLTSSGFAGDRNAGKRHTITSRPRSQPNQNEELLGSVEPVVGYVTNPAQGQVIGRHSYVPQVVRYADSIDQETIEVSQEVPPEYREDRPRVAG